MGKWLRILFSDLILAPVMVIWRMDLGIKSLLFYSELKEIKCVFIK